MNITLNDEERRDWVQNDEGLYIWWKQSALNLHRFVRENRTELTRLIKGAIHRYDGEGAP